MQTRQLAANEPADTDRRTGLGIPLTRWGFPAVLSGVVLYGAAMLGVAAIGGWGGIVGALCLGALLLAMIVASC